MPKYIASRMEPASGTSLPSLGGGSITQRMHVNNSMHGQKAVVMRLRLSWTSESQSFTHQAEVANFPAGL